MLNDSIQPRLQPALVVLHAITLAANEASSLDAFFIRATQLIYATFQPQTLVIALKDELDNRLQVYSASAQQPDITSAQQPLQPDVLADVLSDGQMRQRTEPQPEWHAPLTVATKTIGVLSIVAPQREAMPPYDGQWWVTLATHLAALCDKLRLVESETRWTREWRALQDTIADLSTEFDLRTLLQTILSRAMQLLDTASGALSLYDDVAQELSVVVNYNLPHDYTGLRLKLGEGVSGRVAASGQPLIVNNYPAWGGVPAAYEIDTGRLPYDVVGVPLKAGERLVGVMVVGQHRPTQQFTDADVRLLMLFAHQAALAIEKTRMIEAALKAAERRTNLSQAIQAMSADLAQEDVFEAIHHAVMKIMSCDRFMIALLENARAEIVEVYLVHQGRKVAGSRVEVDGGLSGYVIKNEQALRIDQPDERFAVSLDPNIFGATRFVPASILAVPLTAKHKTIGLLSVQSKTPSTYSADDQELLEQMASHAAIAIDNAQLLASARRRAQELETFRANIADISASLERSKLLKLVLERAKQLLDGDHGAFALYQPETHDVKVEDGPPEFIGRHFKMGEGMLGYVAATKESAVVSDYQSWSRRVRTTLPMPWHSVIGVPLLYGGQLIGALTVASSDPKRQFNESDVQLLKMFADQTAVAIENSKLFEEVQHLAITDALTELHNRRHFFKLAEREFGRSQRYGRPLSVIMLDIDHFKRINDQHGHLIGDQVLRTVAGHLKHSLRMVDLLGRYGGEEFSILLPETEKNDARLVAERLRTYIAELVIETEQAPIKITISQGIASLATHVTRLDTLLDRADRALYSAKRHGRNRVELWRPGLTAALGA